MKSTKIIKIRLYLIYAPLTIYHNKISNRMFDSNLRKRNRCVHIMNSAKQLIQQRIHIKIFITLLLIKTRIDFTY